MHGKAGGITTEFVMNVVENSGGYYESMAIANVLPDKMKMLAEHIDANYKAMSNWYELEFAGDGRIQAPRVQVGTTREGVIQMSTRRPFCESRLRPFALAPPYALARPTVHSPGASAVRRCPWGARRRRRAPRIRS